MRDDLFLDAEALQRLTGRKQKNAQIKVLRAQHVPFVVNALGEPVVAKSIFEARPGSAADKPVKPWRSNALTAPGGNHGPKANRQSQPA